VLTLMLMAAAWDGVALLGGAKHARARQGMGVQRRQRRRGLSSQRCMPAGRRHDVRPWWVSPVRWRRRGGKVRFRYSGTSFCLDNATDQRDAIVACGVQQEMVYCVRGLLGKCIHGNNWVLGVSLAVCVRLRFR
jgi:hypothetical protein